ncbi:lysosomal acid phosphatase-like isoform X2 [Macrosteles quadrilineatus]|uniref:lysosomal acid phosphatase-like isoform X2 n=1 Tax=Macrosteles quadrilineatus TaxID=74068 RepID=UPI0023E1233E|nr:lysosomal acid phosphatase-like isoform X2 [Macrosteles quadrilineatus]
MYTVHGTRAPLYKPYPNNPYKSIYPEHFPGPPGELTDEGKRLMYKVGRRLKAVYGKFIGPYSAENVTITSTDMSRTITSAMATSAGLFPPAEPIFNNMMWQPIPVWHNTLDFDKAYIFNDPDYPSLGLKDCPKYGKMIKEGYELTKNPDPSEANKPIYELLKKHTGRTDINSIDTHYEIWDTIQFESLNGLQQPQWVTQPRPEFNNKPLYPDMMAPLLVELFEKSIYLNKSKEMLSFYAGPLLHHIHEKFMKKSQDNTFAEKFRFHSTHDDTLFALRWGLGLDKPQMIGPGDGFIFELHKETLADKRSCDTVKVFFCNSHKLEIEELDLPKCESPCTLDCFMDKYPGVSPSQWQDSCRSLK